ncbi:MAG: nucleoside deaminase [Lachnospirales bacterium]
MNIKYMEEALEEAKLAYKENEVPIGAVVVLDNKIIGRGHNARMRNKSSISHGEIIAIDNACKNLCDWRLDGADIYVTVEPCLMCAGAILLSRIKGLYYGAKNNKFGACESITNALNHDFNHKVNITSGIMEEECQKIMKDYFRSFRK